MDKIPGPPNTPLHKKLGFKSGMKVVVWNQPRHYLELLGDFPRDVVLIFNEFAPCDAVHLFETSSQQLADDLHNAIAFLPKTGAIWVSWPKKSSGLQCDLTENAIRDLALPIGLVDVKVCAVDATWSGLKLVWRSVFR